jgi:hypothetical protein
MQPASYSIYAHGAASGVLIAFRASRTFIGVAGGMKTACADGIFVVFNAGETRSAARSG